VTLANAYPLRYGSYPNNFLATKDRKLAKNLVYFGLYGRHL